MPGKRSMLSRSDHRLIGNLIQQVGRVADELEKLNENAENNDPNSSHNSEHKQQQENIESYTTTLTEGEKSIRYDVGSFRDDRLHITECPYCQHNGSFNVVIEEHKQFVLEDDNEHDDSKSEYIQSDSNTDISVIRCTNCNKVIFDSNDK